MAFIWHYIKVYNYIIIYNDKHTTKNGLKCVCFSVKFIDTLRPLNTKPGIIFLIGNREKPIDTLRPLKRYGVI